MSGLWRTPSFWWRSRPTLLAQALSPIGWIYGAITHRRMARRATMRAQVPVICVGNFVVGGTGKTPFALTLARLIAETGHKPVFLLRGFGGRLAGPMLVDLNRHTSEDVGDEALLLAEQAPTVVSSDRAAGAQLAESLGSVIIMDDGFQNPSLFKDRSLVLIDKATGVGNGLCLPAGPLRAPLHRQLPFASALVAVGEGKAGDLPLTAAQSKGLPIITGHVEPAAHSHLSGQRIVCFAGIGRPEKVFATARQIGADVVATHAFPDHHVYSQRDAQLLLASAEEHAAILVTTEKDFARLSNTTAPSLRALRAACTTLKITMAIDDPRALVALLHLPKASD